MTLLHYSLPPEKQAELQAYLAIITELKVNSRKSYYWESFQEQLITFLNDSSEVKVKIKIAWHNLSNNIYSSNKYVQFQ